MTTTIDEALRRKLTDEAEEEVAALVSTFAQGVRNLFPQGNLEPDGPLHLAHVQIPLTTDDKMAIRGDFALGRMEKGLVVELVKRRFSAAAERLVSGADRLLTRVEGRAEERSTPRRAMLLYKLNEAGLLNGMRVIAIEDIRADEEIQMVPELFIDRSPI